MAFSLYRRPVLSILKDIVMSRITFSRRPPHTKKRRAASVRLELEFLEARNLLNGTPTNVLVNNPAEDTTAQDTQSETAIVLGANSNIVVAYNDSGSFTASANKYTGYSLSTNGGTSFQDQGTLPDNPEGDGADHVLARSNKTGTIFFSVLVPNSAGTGPTEEIHTYRSLDNGVSFGQPIDSAPGFVAGVDFQDKQWIAVDNFPGPGYGNVYQTWRDFSSNVATNGTLFTRSTDDGLTWGPSGGTPIATDPVNGLTNNHGSYIAVGPDHAVYVFWWDFTKGPDIMMRKSTDQGVTFGDRHPVIVTGLKTHGGNGDLGLTDSAGRTFRSNAFPQAAVNPVTGDIYVVYDDQANGSHDKADIFFTESTDGGATWSKSIRVNDDNTNNDQWQPALALTPDGSHLGVFWYDRRLDPANNLIDRFGVIATVSGHTVTFAPNFRITDVSFLPAFGQDPFVNAIDPAYMGDYDMATADNNYFYTTWGDNRLSDAFFANQPDVRFAQIPVGGLQDSALSLTSATLVASSLTTSSNPSAIPTATPGLLTTRESVMPQAEIRSQVMPAGAHMAAVDQLFSAAAKEHRKVPLSRLNPQAWWHEPARRDDFLESATL
jgi:hypothetical protein